jgi:tellurite resistance protein
LKTTRGKIERGRVFFIKQKKTFAKKKIMISSEVSSSSTSMSQQRRQKLQEIEENNDNLQHRVDVLLRRTSKKESSSTFQPSYSVTRKQSAPVGRRASVSAKPSSSSLVRDLVGKYDRTAEEGLS